MSLRSLLRTISLPSYLLGLTLSLGTGGAYLAFSGTDTESLQATGTAVAVERRTISSSVKALGTVTFADEQELRFNQRGTVTNVFAKEGDRVKKGQIIAQLDTSSVLADIRQAELSISASNLQLEQLRTDQALAAIDAENAAEDARRQLAQAQSSLGLVGQQQSADLAAARRSVQEKEAALAQAQLALANVGSEEDDETDTLVQEAAQTAQDILTASEKLLDSFYGTLTLDAAARPEQGDYDIDVDERLWNEIAKRDRAVFSYFTAVHAVDDMRRTYGSLLVTERDPETITAALTDALSLAEALYRLSDDAYVMIQGASTDPTDFTVSDLEAERNSINANRSTASGLIDQARTAQRNLLDETDDDDGDRALTIKQRQDAVRSAENALTLSRENLQLKLSGAPGDFTQQSDSVAKLEEQLEARQASLDTLPRENEIAEQLRKNDIAQKAASLQKTAKALDDYRLTAPFDGVIRQLDFKVGDNLLDTGEDKLLRLENPDFLIVTVPLDQVDVVKVREGMSATVTFDALPGRQFTGVIEEIDPSATVQSGVVSYQVSIQLPSPADVTILSGMTATVDIELSRKDAVLTVPNLALRREADRVTVQTEAGESRDVVVGATDGRYTEILSGLEEGDRVLSINLAAAQSVSSAAGNPFQMMRGGGGGGGGGGAAPRAGAAIAR